MLVADHDGTGFGFRHEIARETVESSLSPAARTRMHATALAALTRLGGTDDHRLAHHAAGCGRHEDAVRYSVAAASRSARLGAHREAAREFALALRFPEVLDRGQVASLEDRLSYECYLTNRIEDALAARRRALELRREDGDLESLGATQRWMSRLSWFLGRGEDADRFAEQAVATLEPLGPGHELAMALSNRAQLAMLAGDVVETTRWGERAVTLARSIGDRDVESHALNNLGTALLTTARPGRRDHPPASEPRHRRDRRPARARRPRLHQPRGGAGPDPCIRGRRPRPARRDRVQRRARPGLVGHVHVGVARHLDARPGPVRGGRAARRHGGPEPERPAGQPHTGARRRGHGRAPPG